MKVVDSSKQSNNKSYLYKILDEQIFNARLFGGYFSVVVIEVPVPVSDFFDAFRDKANRLTDDLDTWLNNNVRKNEYSVRFEEGKYVLILNSIRNIDQLSAVIERLYYTMLSELNPCFCESESSVKIGVSIFPFDGETPADLIRKAESAGSNVDPGCKMRCRFYNEKIIML